VPFRRDSVRQHAGVKITADKSEHSTVLYSLCQSSHQNVVVHAVKEGREVHVDHPLASLLDVALRFDNCVVRSLSGSEAVTV